MIDKDVCVKEKFILAFQSNDFIVMTLDVLMPDVLINKCCECKIMLYNKRSIKKVKIYRYHRRKNGIQI